MRPEFVVAGLGVAMLVSCAVPAQRDAQVVGEEDVPFALLEPDAPPLAPPATALATRTVPLCFVREGRLVVVEYEMDPPVELLDIIGALAEPPTGGDSLRTVLSDRSIVREARLSGGIARVDLRSAITSLGGDDQLLAIAQIVCTLTTHPGVGQVSFTLEGSPVDVPRGDGSLVAAPVSRDDYASLFP